MRGNPGRGKNLNRDKAKFNFKSLQKILGYAKGSYVLFLIAIVLSIIGVVFQVISPKQIEHLTNEIANGAYTGVMNFDLIYKYSIILIIFYATTAVLSYVGHYIMTTITQKLSKHLRTRIDIKLNKLPLSFYDKSSRGNIMSVITNDIDTLSQTLSNNLNNLISGIILLIGSITMMFVTNYILAFVTIGTSILGLVIMMFIMVKSQKYYVRNQSQLGILNGQIEEIYSNHKVVVAFNGQKKEKVEFKKNNKALYASNRISQFMGSLMYPIMGFFGNLGFVMIYVVSFFLLENGGLITFGIISSFLIYQRLFTQPLGQIAQSVSGLQQASAASMRVNQLLDQSELRDETKLTKEIVEVKGKVEFKNVDFGYSVDRKIINNFSAIALPQQKIAIVGPTGAGKTTIVNLLMKFYEINSGDILIDDVSISELKRENVHKLFDMVLQDTWIFNGTIRDNIVYNMENIDDEKIMEVCETVGIKHFIECLPNGLDTIINEQSQISEGQKQQITIARAMIENAPLLILDEATSSLDTMTELIIQQAMDKLTVGRTSFIIAHRLSTIKNADIILVMNDGDIVEKGSHLELLALNGFYSKLYNSQFENEGILLNE
jgi:ATP-binding cassette subfamily B protein